MRAPISQHQVEVQRNRQAWQSKPILREIYAGFYARILALLDPNVPGRIVEIGSGIGNLKTHLPGTCCTDLFPNPWLDLVCDGYDLPFARGSLSHLILFDVFHHLQSPNAFLNEARRVLGPGGRILIFEPYVSWCSIWAYGVFHHEPLGWNQPINFGPECPRPRRYYAAQANATRLFFIGSNKDWVAGWRIFHAEVFAGFSYLLSGGFSQPAFYPRRWLPWLQRWDARLSRWPRLFGARCLVGLSSAPVS